MICLSETGHILIVVLASLTFQGQTNGHNLVAHI